MGRNTWHDEGRAIHSLVISFDSGAPNNYNDNENIKYDKCNDFYVLALKEKNMMAAKCYLLF
jgi:hypothetical protein